MLITIFCLNFHLTERIIQFRSCSHTKNTSAVELLLPSRWGFDQNKLFAALLSAARVGLVWNHLVQKEKRRKGSCWFERSLWEKFPVLGLFLHIEIQTCKEKVRSLVLGCTNACDGFVRNMLLSLF